MATRARGKRPQNVAEEPVPPAKRARGGRVQRQREEEAGNDAATIEPSWSQERGYSGPISHRIASRRGAPQASQAGSFMSFATPGRDIGNDESDEESEKNEALKAQREVMIESLPDLSSATGKLIAHLRSPERQSARYKFRLKVRRNAFEAQHETFEAPDESTFIDGEVIQDIGQNDNPVVAQILDTANLASALDIVEIILTEDDAEVHNLLAELDEFFHKLPTAQNPQLALDIRTLRLIEEQAQRKTKADLNKTIASIFCDVPETTKKPDYPKLFVHGPFKRLDHEDDEDEETNQLRYNRIQEIIESTRDVRKGNGATQLRERFLLEKILDNLREFLFLSVDAQAPIPRAAEDEFHDAAEQLESGSQAESQPIRRLGEEPQRSFFKDISSLSALGRIPESSPIPPSNQQQHEDTNSVFLGPRPASVVTVTEEEEDPFQQDARPVNKGKAAAISETLRQAAPPRPSPQQTQPSSSMPPPPRPTISTSQVPPTPSSSFEAIQQQKQRFTQEHRAQAASSMPTSSSTQRPDATSYRQRQPWTAHDCDLLLELIAMHQAGWSIIQNSHQGDFDHKRHQQAYRDKARNMKVDFMLADAVLPPSFDLVALGKKEVERLISFGKNPYRRERDVDDAGNAINTEYVH